ncbi:MAG: ABC-2 transporter permease [Bacillota bacterium]|nr:ABC-2 transporter permease [Bacillota bacterium]
MINLIRKDILISLSKWNVITLSLFSLFYFNMLDNITVEKRLLLLAVIIPFFIMQTSFSFDDRNKSIRMIRSLPVRPEEVIYSKYLGMVINYAVITLVLQLILFILNILGLNIGIISFHKLLLSGVFIMLVTSISFPVYFKLSYNKSRIFNIIFVIFILTMLNFFFSGDMGSLYNVEKYLDKTNMYFILAILVTLLIYFISSIISINLYKTRDL